MAKKHIKNILFSLTKLSIKNSTDNHSYESLILIFLFSFNLLDFMFLNYCIYHKNFINSNYIYVVISILIVFIGNLLPKLKKNNFIGMVYT